MCVCVYYIILYCIILYYIILYFIILYYIILCYVMLYYIMLCYIILCYVILYYIIIYIYIYQVLSSILFLIFVQSSLNLLRCPVATGGRHRNRRLQEFHAIHARSQCIQGSRAPAPHDLKTLQGSGNGADFYKPRARQNQPSENMMNNDGDDSR